MQPLTIFLKRFLLPIVIFLVFILEAEAQNALQQHYGFIENKGQLVDQNYLPNTAVKYIFCGNGLNTHLRQTGFSYELRVIEKPNGLDEMMSNINLQTDRKKMRELDLQTKIRTHRIDIELVGCNKNAIMLPENPASDYINYYTTNTLPDGVLSVKHYNKVTYKNIYNNIDLEFLVGAEDAVKYNFIIYPGGNINEIQLQYNGADYTTLNTTTEIKIGTSIKMLTENIPYSFEIIDTYGERKVVAVNYEEIEKNTFSFSSKNYNSSNTLVIDPTPNVSWGSYYGSTGGDYGMGIVLDANGNSIATGDARSMTNIATVGAFQTVYAGGGDIFIAKFNIAGVLQWATYYGGSGWDGGTSITADATGNVFVTAWITGNGVFSTVGAHQPNYGGGPWDALVAKFSPAGARLWSTYYGGSLDDEGWGITCDALGNVIVTGNTESSNNISSVGAHQTTYGGGTDDAFIAKFTNNGTFLWGTYYGGTGTETDWFKSGITTDNNNNIILANWTNSPNTGNVIATPGAYQTILNGSNDAFLVKFSPAGVRLWGTYYGGTNFDVAYGVVCDVTNNIVFVGRTMSTANIATIGSHQTTLSGSEDAMIVKFDQNGNRLWGTYYGGIGTEQAYNVDNICSQIVVIGYTNSASGIAFGSNLHQPALGGGQDAFIAMFDQALGTIVWGTYFGGSGTESPYWDESTISSNNGGDFVIIGNTTSTNNIAYGSPHQGALSGFNNAFIARFTGSGTFTVNSSQNNVTCSGGNNGTATVTPTGGNAPYTYLWTPTNQTTQTATGLTAGTYTVNITDANGCTSQQIITITQPVALSATSSSTQTNCISANGTATVSPSGGTSPYTYLWNNGQTTQMATGLSAGTYTVVITDANGCTLQTTVNVTSTSSPTASAQAQTNILCNGGNNGSATVSVTGGQGPYSYAWNPSGQTTQAATGLSAGVYTVIVTDANGCTAQQTFTIIQPNALTASINPTHILCNGGNNGNASTNVSGGTSPYTYLWSNGQTTQTTTGLTAGTYTVTITDANGCTLQQTVSITQPNVLSAVINPTHILCNGGNNGNATINVNGGTSPYTYLWSNGQTTQTASGLNAGNYTVTVTDNNGCTIQQTITITQPSALSATNSTTQASCGQNNGTATINVTGGTSPYTYLWNNGQTSQTATGLLAGTYTVVITDANGCTLQQTLTINQLSGMNLSTSVTQVLCNGGNDGTATVNPSGGNSPYTFLWNNGQTTQTATGLAAGTYTIIVTDANGCTDQQTVSITQPTAISLNTNSLQATCTAANGSATVNATGGTSPYTYLWNNGQTTQTATALASGNYTIVVTDANGCTQTQTTSVTSINPLTLAVNSTPTGCAVNNGTATVSPSNGTAPYVYLWNNGQATQTATGLSVGAYTVLVTDANGCTQSQTISVTQTVPPVANASATNTTINTGDNTQLNATGGVSYSWSPSTGNCDTCATTLVTPNQTTTYCVWVADANGCTDSACVTIFVETPCYTESLNTLLPNAFSPNNDGHNDKFCIPTNVCIVKFVIQIYDRWGNKVFETDNVSECWDGSYKGELLNSAVFVYYFNATLSNGDPFFFKGNISLIK